MQQYKQSTQVCHVHSAELHTLVIMQEYWCYHWRQRCQYVSQGCHAVVARTLHCSHNMGSFLKAGAFVLSLIEPHTVVIMQKWWHYYWRQRCQYATVQLQPLGFHHLASQRTVAFGNCSHHDMLVNSLIDIILILSNQSVFFAELQTML